MSIGRNIRNLRLQHGLSQRELAEIAGVTDKAVSTWELDKKDPRMGPIQRMADYFGIKKSDIIEPVQVPATQRMVINSTPLNEEETELVTNYRKIGDEDKRLVFGVASRLAGVSGDNYVL